MTHYRGQCPQHLARGYKAREQQDQTQHAAKLALSCPPSRTSVASGSGARRSDIEEVTGGATTPHTSVSAICATVFSKIHGAKMPAQHIHAHPRINALKFGLRMIWGAIYPWSWLSGRTPQTFSPQCQPTYKRPEWWPLNGPRELPAEEAERLARLWRDRILHQPTEVEPLQSAHQDRVLLAANSKP